MNIHTPKPQDKLRWIAHNPEDECDARWFHSYEQAYDHFCEYGEFYRYTEFNEAERTCEFLDEDFRERRDNTVAEVEASNADAFYQFCREMDGALL